LAEQWVNKTPLGLLLLAHTEDEGAAELWTQPHAEEKNKKINTRGILHTGLFDGTPVNVGHIVGPLVVGLMVGALEANGLAVTVGLTVGLEVGLTVGLAVGLAVGLVDTGRAEGLADNGRAEGLTDNGRAVGFALGDRVGLTVFVLVGMRVGAAVKAATGTAVGVVVVMGESEEEVGATVGCSEGPVGSAVGVTEVNETPAQKPSFTGICTKSLLVPMGTDATFFLTASNRREAKSDSTEAALFITTPAAIFCRFAAAAPAI
jgi:hypothetical protein